MGMLNMLTLCSQGSQESEPKTVVYEEGKSGHFNSNWISEEEEDRNLNGFESGKIW